MNAHDLDAFVACFAVDYHSEQPAHPSRAFDGRDQVRENWSGVFAGIPDLVAELRVFAVTDEGVEVAEWWWHGTHVDGEAFDMRGTTVLGIEGRDVVCGRLNMEPVERDGVDIHAMVQATYRPPAPS